MFFIFIWDICTQEFPRKFSDRLALCAQRAHNLAPWFHTFGQLHGVHSFWFWLGVRIRFRSRSSCRCCQSLSNDSAGPPPQVRFIVCIFAHIGRTVDVCDSGDPVPHENTLGGLSTLAKFLRQGFGAVCSTTREWRWWYWTLLGQVAVAVADGVADADANCIAAADAYRHVSLACGCRDVGGVWAECGRGWKRSVGCHNFDFERDWQVKRRLGSGINYAAFADRAF